MSSSGTSGSILNYSVVPAPRRSLAIASATPISNAEGDERKRTVSSVLPSELAMEAKETRKETAQRCAAPKDTGEEDAAE